MPDALFGGAPLEQLVEAEVRLERELTVVDLDTAKALHDRPLRWAYPPQLGAYVAEGGHDYSVRVDHAQHAANPGTFDGVDDFDFVVVGARTLPDRDAGALDEDALLNTAEIRRYLTLRGRRGGAPPGRARRDGAPLPLDEAVALMRLRDELAGLSESDWARLAAPDAADGPSGTWAAAQERLDRYLHGPERAAALRDEAVRDAEIQAARAAIDPVRQAAAIDELRGAEDLYEAIVESETTNSENSVSWVEAAALQKMWNALDASRFRTVAEFDAAVLRLRDAVRRQAVLHALAGLADGERVLQAEAQRYRDMGQVIKLATALSTAPAEADKPDALRVRTEYPLLRDRVVYDGAKASRYPENLQELLAQNIEAQFRNVAKGRKELRADPDLVFGLDLVMDETLAAMGLPPASVQAQVIRAGRGVNNVSVWDVLLPILTVLSFAAGPLAWVGYLANLGALGIQIGKSYEKERQKAIHRLYEHAGRQLATGQRLQGVLEWFDSFMEPLGIIGGVMGGLHLPEATGPPLIGETPPGRPVPALPDGTPPGGRPVRLLTDGSPPAGEPIPPRGSPMVPHEPGGPLAIPEHGPWVSRADSGVIEIRHSDQRGMLRITKDRYEVYLDPSSSTPTFSHTWENHDLQFPPKLLEQNPHMAGLRDIDRVTLGGRQFGIGVSPEGWFVYAPGTRNTFITGRFPGAAAETAASAPVLPGTVSTIRPPLALPPGDSMHAFTDDLRRALAADYTIGRRILDPAGDAKMYTELVQRSYSARELIGTTTPGLWERVGFDRLREDLRLPDARFTIPRKSRETDDYGNALQPGQRSKSFKIEMPDGSLAATDWTYDTATGRLRLDYVNIDKTFPRRFIDIQPQLVPGRGVPLGTYLSICMMKWFEQAYGVGLAGRRILELDTIVNVESVAQLALAKLRGIPEATALRNVKVVQMTENLVVQSGGRIVEVRFATAGWTEPWETAADVKQRADLFRSTGIALPLKMQVRRGFNIEVVVENPPPPPPPEPPGE
ncbi:proline-rich domain-containing protein, partial [Actinomadura fibrosa]|uniref:proline-rich domain-containing protein n=1 Tax=Actinomadura fibrosa TaxID=111802 RepID=UPI001A9560C0